MPRKRRLFERAFKAKVALDAVCGPKTVVSRRRDNLGD